MIRRWLLVWCVCFGLIFVAGASALFLVHVALPAEAREPYARMLADSARLLIIAAVLGLTFSGMLAHWITRTCFTPVRRLAEWVRLITRGNPDYRIDIELAETSELRELAQAINQLAEHNRQNLRDIENRITEANATLVRERSHLAALLSDLAQSVVVCNAEGRVLLYNEQSRRLFDTPAMHGLLGLGRPLYDLLDQAVLSREYTALRARLDQREARPVSEFPVTLSDGRAVQARMAPVRHDTATDDPRPTSEGYVLLLSDEGTAAEPPAVALSSGDLALDARPVYYDFDLFHQSGQSQESDDRPLRELAYTVFDTETTGLDPSSGDEIIAIGAVRIVNGRLLPGETYHQLVDPHRAIDPASVRVHGITPAMLAGQPAIHDVLPVFHRFCAGTVLVGHNAAFDMRFLELKEQISGTRFTAPVLDTMLLSAVLHEDRLEHRLDAIAQRLGVAAIDRHTALGDAITTARVFVKLLELLAARGITTLRQARDASARTIHARIRY